jgi:integrase
LLRAKNIKYLQSQLGRATPAITLNVYAHLMKDRNPEAAQRLENSVLGGNSVLGVVAKWSR